jgi:hypothetical protein
MLSRIKRAIRINPAIAGLPIIGICLGGCWALTTFQQGRFERVDVIIRSQTEDAFNLEEELDKILKKMDLRDYNPIPIPGLDGKSRVKVDTTEEED